MGAIRLDEGDYSRAKELFSGVAGRRSDDVGAEAQYSLGETFYRQKDFKQAVGAFVRVKYLYPGSREWIARAYLRLGECYEKTSEKGKAKDAYLTVAKLHGNDEFGKEADRKMRELQ